MSNLTNEHLTDLENARRFAKEHGADLRYVTRFRHWLVWDGQRWRRDETNEVQRRAKETVRGLHAAALKLKDSGERKERLRHALGAQRANRIGAMASLAVSEPGISVSPETLDADPWLFNVENGTLDLRIGILGEHRRDDLITKLAPVKYDAEATCPTWAAFLHRVTAEDDKLVRYIQKIVGYGLTGVAREQCLFVLHGSGANGKSTTLAAVTSAVGGYAQHTPTETLLVKRNDTIPNDVARLHGARIVTAAEAECNRQLAEALIKQMTGGDKIAARFLHGEFFEFTPTFKLFLAVNHKPVIRGTDHAIWRRIRLLPFTVTIPESEQDKTLPNKLEAERAGILRWAVEGCLAWQKEGLEPPEVVKNATDNYRDEMDPVGTFIDERCMCGPILETPASVLYASFMAWCRDNNEPTMSKMDFGARLTEKGFLRVRTKSTRSWRGISVTE
jgi:putative DNA primase/helicase